MPFFVAAFREVPSARLDDALAVIRSDLASSRRYLPSRRDARVFQRLNYPTHLLAISEWGSPAEYDRFRRSARYEELTAGDEPPGRIEYLSRLRLFARMSSAATVVGCVILDVPATQTRALESFILDEVRAGIESAAGLVTHEVYRLGPPVGRLLVVHSWRTFEDLERFRSSDRTQYEQVRGVLGATAVRWTGVVAAELSVLDTGSTVV